MEEVAGANEEQEEGVLQWLRVWVWGGEVVEGRDEVVVVEGEEEEEVVVEVVEV